MSYRHPKAQELYRYKPAIDFVTKSVTEKKLVEMIKGTENEVQAAASMIEAMARHSTGLEVRERLKMNQELVEGLWNGAFWDTEKAPEDKDADISEDALIYGNIQPSCGEALTEILDPFIDHTNIIAHIMPHIALAEQKEPYEFCDFLTSMPGIASLAILAPETGVLSVVGKMITNEEQLPYALTALQHLSEGLMLAKWSLGQSNDIYPALIKVLREGEESSKNKILSSLDSLLYGSTASRMKFINSGGMKPLLDAIALEDERISRKAISSFISLVTDFPEGAKAAIDAGAIAVLEAKEDLNDVFERKSDALELLKSYKDILDVDRIELTPEGYATFGKGLSEPGAIKRLVKNLKSSLDEKELAIAGGLLPIFTDMLRSSTDLVPLLEALRAIYVADGALLSGHNIAVRMGLQCGLPDMLRPLIESEDETVRERATEVLDAVEVKHNDEIQQDEDEEDEEGGVGREAEDETEVSGADNEG